MKHQHFNLISIIGAVVAVVFGAFPVSVHANKSPLIAMVAVGGALPVSVDAKKSPLVAVAVAAGVLSTVNAEKCKRGDYGCGKGRGTEPYWTDTCSENACCCGQTDLGGYHMYTCGTGDFVSATKGCMSCLGDAACKDVALTVKIGDQSCVNKKACKDVKGNSIIYNHSCRSESGCRRAKNVVIGPNSCGIGQPAGQGACEYMSNSNVGSNSCQKQYSCYSLTYGDSLSIGDNACNLDRTCYECENGSTVPNGACNTEGADDVIYQWCPTSQSGTGGIYCYQCKYCIANNNMATVSASYTTSTRRRLESAEEDLEKDCGVLARALLDYTDQSISEYAAFRDFIRGDACNGKYNNALEFIANKSTGTCKIDLTQLWSSRPNIGDEQTGKEYIGKQIQKFESVPPILQGFTLTSLAATDEEFECESDVSIKSGKSGKSGKIAPAQAQTIDDGGSKSGKSGSGKEEPKTKRRRQPSV